MTDLNPLNWNWNQCKAAGKHVVSYVAGGVSVAAALHFISPEQATDITGNLTHVANGLEEFTKGLLGLISAGTVVYTTLRSAKNASPSSQAASLVKEAPGTTVITTPEIAKAVPSESVVSNTDVKVVTK